MQSIQASLLAFLTLTFSASTAFAALECPGLTPRPFSKIESHFTVPDGSGRVIQSKSIDCKKVALGAKVVTDIQRMITPALLAPASIQFNMVDVYDNAFFYPLDFSLNVPYQIIFDGYTKNPVFTVAVWAHEFGHAVFNQNIKEVTKKWYAFLKPRLDPSVGDPEDVVYAFVRAYNEYFADVIAVLYTGRGDSVAEGLHFTGLVANPEGAPSKCANRSSEECRPRNNTQNDMSKISTNRDFTERRNQLGTWRGINPANFHNVLAPARFHIWKYYLSNPLIKKEKARLAAATIDSIIADVNTRMLRVSKMRGGFNIDNMNRELSDVQRINRDFIQTLDATFEKQFPRN
jgi:hypothetical protein